MKADTETLANAAKNGDKEALEELIANIQDKVYGLALRMLYDPADAQDASQEILLKIVTHLGTFRGESSFNTWMYRVAANHLLSFRKRKQENQACSFEEYEEALDLETAATWQGSNSDALQNLIVEEIRISCLQGLLLCLDREHRLAYLLADVFDVTGDQGGAILEVSPQVFRKRLSRARERIRDFLTKNCALIDTGNPCKCERFLTSYLNNGELDRDRTVFANHPCRIKGEDTPLQFIQEMDELNRIAFLYKRYPDFNTPAVFVENIRNLLNSRRYQLL